MIRNWKISFIASLICLTFSLFHLQIAGAEENPCLKCHSNIKEVQHIHSPLSMGCAACHKLVEGKSHPDQKGSIILVQSMPGLCFNCHEESKLNGKIIHAPVASGMCIACHNPHGSKFSKLLKSEQQELCFMCHDKALFSKKYVHKVINVIGCTTCHNPHASNNPSLLPNPINEICSTCHKTQSSGLHIVALPGKKQHPIKGIKDISTLKYIKVPDPKNPKKEIEIPDASVPGKELSCVSCHNPHSSDYENLFTVQRICLKCHKY
jgi:predicted CXXCH cytochrome family protein